MNNVIYKQLEDSSDTSADMQFACVHIIKTQIR